MTLGKRPFGLTGGIACGKSTVAKVFAAKGAPLVDMDLVAHEVQAPGTRGFHALLAAFGRDILDATGAIDRKVLGTLVFKDNRLLRLLDRTIGPFVLEQLDLRVQDLYAAGHRFVGVESAILIEKGLADTYRPLVVVTTSREEQLRRLMARNGLSEEDARARINSQLPLREKVPYADFVIDNSGNEAFLPDRVDEALRRIALAI